jgi:hypothetical protein
MAVGTGYSKIATNGLIFAYDIGDTRNSFLGRPTTNLSAGYGMSTYNNVGGNVSSTLTGTGTYYRGAEIIKQDLTALDGTGASYLSNGNNPGIGVVTSGGGGVANTYTGHSIFFKPTVTMNSNPIYTNYSNIGGWQSSTNYEDMGDGWFRAYVLWYNTITQSDGKYWAINPLSTITGQTVTIYWAGPFKESLNSTSISQFINGTRSSTQGVIDVSGGGSSINVSNASFTNPSINPQLTFDGTDDYINVTTNLGTLSQYTIEHVSYKGSNDRMPIASVAGPLFYQYGDNSWYYTHGGSAAEYYYPKSFAINGWGQWTITYDGSYVKIYRNGVYEGQQASSGTANWTNGLRIGNYTGGGYPWNGQIAVAKMYNRALSATEVQNNYNHYKTRFNLST